MTSVAVVQESFASCMGNKAEEDILLGVGLGLSLALTRRTDLDTTAKGANVRKVFFHSSCLEDTRGDLLGTPKGIGNTEMMEECIRPNLISRAAPSRRVRT